MRIAIRESAYADVVRIHDWIAKDNPSNAGSVVERIGDAVERIAFFPHMGRNGRVSGTREWVVRGLPYIIVYRVNEALDELTVLAVFHGAQNRLP